MTSHTIAAHSITVRFAERLVLSGASLTLDPGTVTVVLGRNGAGKTTLFRAVAGERSPLSGVVQVGSASLPRWRLRDLARHGLWWWPQGGFLARGLTIADQVALLGLREPAAPERFAGHAERFGAKPAVLASRPSALSTGERRLIEAAMVSAVRPATLLADEPLAGLSPLVATQVGEEFRALAASGSAIGFSTHEAWVAEAFADRVAWLSGGVLRSFPSLDAARKDWAFQTEYLGRHPSTI